MAFPVKGTHVGAYRIRPPIRPPKGGEGSILSHTFPAGMTGGRIQYAPTLPAGKRIYTPQAFQSFLVLRKHTPPTDPSPSKKSIYAPRAFSSFLVLRRHTPPTNLSPSKKSISAPPSFLSPLVLRKHTPPTNPSSSKKSISAPQAFQSPSIFRI